MIYGRLQPLYSELAEAYQGDEWATVAGRITRLVRDLKAQV